MLRRLIPLVALAAGCSDDGEPAYPTAFCQYDTSYVHGVELADADELGFSAADVVARLAARNSATLTWHDGRSAELAITVDVAPGTRAEVYAPPPHQGFCTPSLEVDATLRLVTADGRLDLSSVATIFALGYDGTIQTVFPIGAGGPIPDPNDLAIPAAWHDARRPRETLAIELHVDEPGHRSPYCTPDQTASMDAAVPCNRYDGVLLFAASAPQPETDDDFFRGGLAWWTWR